MMMAMAVVATVATAKTPSDYCQDGLIHHWDGYDNAGTGAYDSSATVWKDLVTTDAMDLTLSGSAAFSTDADDYSLKRLTAPSTSDSRMAFGTASVTTAETIEVVIKRKEWATYAVVFSPYGHTYGLLAMKNDDIGSNSSGYFCSKEANNGAFATITYVHDGNSHRVYTNGVASVKTTTSEGWSGGMDSIVQIGGRATEKKNCFYGRVYAVRLYNTVLTDKQIAENHAIDVKRFVDGDFSSGADALTIVGDPENYGTPTPNYGETKGLAVGAELTLSSVTTYTNAEETMKVDCVGYTLYSNKLAVATHDFKDGEARTYQYVHPKWPLTPRFVWRFDNLCYRIAASASSEGATVTSSAGEWVKPGEQVTLTAHYDSTNLALLRWEGVDGVTSGDSITFAMPNAGVTAVARLAVRTYVSTDGDDEHSGTSPDQAFKTIGAAIKKAATDQTSAVITVGPGTYEYATQLTVDNDLPLRIVASEGADKTFIVRTAKMLDGASNHLLLLNSAGTTMEGFTFTQSDPANSGRAIDVEAGTLSACVVSNFYGNEVLRVGANGHATDLLVCENHQSDRSAVVQMTGGLLERSRIVRNFGSNDAYGEALEFWEGGTVRNCLIADNTNLCDHTAGVYLYKGNSVLENCTVVNNVSLGSTAVAGIIGATGSAVVNCIVFGNRNNGGILDVDTASKTQGKGTMSTGSYTACSTAWTGEGNVTVSSVDFADASAGDYRVLGGPTVDTAQRLAWMDGALDLAGASRIQGKGPDMGCYETELGPLRATVNVSSRDALGKGSFTLTSTVTGEDTTGLTYAWRVTCGDREVATGDQPQLVLTDLGVGVYDVALTVDNASGESFEWQDGTGLIDVHPLVAYVSRTSTPKYPYADWATAANTLEDALAKVVDGMTILIAEGDYPVTRGAEIGKAITVRSVAGRDKTRLVRTVPDIMTLTIANAAARVEGVTITQALGCDGLVLEQSAGVLADSAIVGCRFIDSQTTSGRLTHIEGDNAMVTNTVWRDNICYADGAICCAYRGLVVGCIFERNASDHDDYGGAILASAPVVIRNCLVRNNTNSLNTAGIALYNGCPTIESCTIIDNVSTGATEKCFAAGVDGSGSTEYSSSVVRAAKLLNCIVYGNKVCGVETNVSSMATVSATYTLSDVLISGEGNVAGDPQWKGSRPSAGSPAVGAGLVQPWMTDATDITGRPRLRNDGKVDLGCCACRSFGSLLFIK